ncbi:hypothetical protein SNE40_002516 [Patella caerulea]|uniref:Uncharacterized protein n=1 Tax=Patella caerulea TaxID=87958 RepID=A0AAN8PZ99_PATCE
MTPQKKSAIFWYSYPPNDDEILELSEHAGCPVVLGEKWVSNKWIWAYGNSFTRPCGLTPDHTQLRLECEHGNSPFKENCTKLESEYINIMSKLILNERLNATDYVPF